MATVEALRLRQDFTEFDSSLHEENLEDVIKMESDLVAWTQDHSSRPDPFRLPKSSEKLWFVAQRLLVHWASFRCHTSASMASNC